MVLRLPIMERLHDTMSDTIKFCCFSSRTPA